MIKIDKFQKALNLFELNECGLISNDNNFMKIYMNIINLNEKT